MTSYQATIRFEADTVADAEIRAEAAARETGGSVVSWLPVGGAPGRQSPPSEPPRYVTEAIEAAKRELTHSINHVQAEMLNELDRPSDVLVERVAKRLAERRLMGDPILPGADGPVRVPTLNRCSGHLDGRWCSLAAGHAGFCEPSPV